MIDWSDEIGISDDIKEFRTVIRACIRRDLTKKIKRSLPPGSQLDIYQFYPQMIAEVCQKVHNLIENGVEPGEIVILSPFLSDALCGSLVNGDPVGRIPPPKIAGHR